jgi:hypothetical protein
LLLPLLFINKLKYKFGILDFLKLISIKKHLNKLGDYNFIQF